MGDVIKGDFGGPVREDGQSESDRVIRELEGELNRGASVSPPYRWKPRRSRFSGAVALTARARAYFEEQAEPVSRIVSRESITGQTIRKAAEG